MTETHGGYYVPHGSHWPMVGSVGLTTMLVGFAMHLNGSGIGLETMAIGAAIVIFMMFGWFGTVIRESEAHMYNDQVDRSFRWGMSWFIFSEVMFFAAFFGALFYARMFSVPWLGGEDPSTHQLLYPDYQAAWPTNGPAEMGGAFETIPAWGIPALNTLILLTSGVTVTLAHWALKKNNRGALVGWLLATVALGFTFLGFQIHEYGEAYRHLNLTLESGIYGSTFFMLTGFHGAHVTIGAIMLTVIMFRAIKGHFTPDRHFAFEAVAWYWHFVDVVWLGLFIFVYWL
ncbi:cytochrome c oxidase subunit 3 [Thiohalobacter sp.]|uniref:cytochrome c oxidase subunit 3 n=1 Tax=Thiohalobacter sp. TaxID=2025948 RepID=UPI0026258FD3|nr:cytochrome c oxidase subunit 3 [Thiohalobacter sp.]